MATAVTEFILLLVLSGLLLVVTAVLAVGVRIRRDSVVIHKAPRWMVGLLLLFCVGIIAFGVVAKIWDFKRPQPVIEVGRDCVFNWDPNRETYAETEKIEKPTDSLLTYRLEQEFTAPFKREPLVMVSTSGANMWEGGRFELRTAEVTDKGFNVELCINPSSPEGRPDMVYVSWIAIEQSSTLSNAEPKEKPPAGSE